MTSAIFGHQLPLTEEEFLAIGETSERIELFDGSLFVTAAPTPRHQVISRRLANAFDTGAGRVLKMHYYAAAGIPWYLIVEQDTGALHLYELAGRQYREHSVTQPGEVLRLTDPVDATIAPEELLPPR